MSIRTDNTDIDSDLVDNNETATQTHPVRSVTESRVTEGGTMNQAGLGERVLNLITVIDIVGIEFVHGILNHLNIYQAFRFTTTCRAVRELGNDKIMNGPEMLNRNVALSIAHHVCNRCIDAFQCRMTEGVGPVIRPNEDNKTGHNITVETPNNECLLRVGLLVDPSLHDMDFYPLYVRFYVNSDLVRDLHPVTRFTVIPTSVNEGTIRTFDVVALPESSVHPNDMSLKTFQYTNGVIDIFQQLGVI
jgi:hypothetical protein